MRTIYIADTTFRDGQQSLWATGMRTDMMLPVAPAMDRAGFASMEVIGSIFFKKAIRELHDDPWERLDQLALRVRQTPMRAIRGRELAAFQLSSPELSALWDKRLAAHGVRQLRVLDPSNTVAHLARMVREAHDAGLTAIVDLIYSLSPKHTPAYYAERTRAVVAAERPDRLCFKDPGGLLTPETTRSVGEAILANADGIPVEFHTHCTTGLGPLCVLAAVELGIAIVHTAIPPLADGSSNPSVFNVVHNLRTLGYRVEVDERALEPVRERLTKVARREGLPIGEPVEYDAGHYLHQVPGGMLSNLASQLARLGMADRLPAVLEECAAVRRDLGYPIMVTPYSQFVGTQAVMNVIRGERYAEVPDEVIHYALGHWGEEERDDIDPAVRGKILDRPRARELEQQRPQEVGVEELRQRLGGPQLSDDELLLRYFSSPADVAALRRGPRPPVAAAPGALLEVLEAIARSPHRGTIRVEKGSFRMTVARR